MRTFIKNCTLVLCGAIALTAALVTLLLVQPNPDHRQESGKLFAAYLLRCLKYAEQDHRASGSTDLDGDGIGEFVNLSEMKEEIAEECAHDFKLIAGRGYLEKVGYTFRVILPGTTDDRERAFFIIGTPNKSARLLPLILIMNEKGILWEIDESVFASYVRGFFYEDVLTVTDRFHQTYP